MPAINDQFTATVRDLSTDGSGIVEHPDGQVFFVGGVWPGETARFAVTGFKQRFGFARLVELLEPSAQRVTPSCAHHGSGSRDCGGCPWQFVSYPAQLEAKEERLRQALSRLQLADEVAPIWGAPAVFGYRNRAQFKTDGRLLGYVAAGSRQLAPVSDCPILTPTNQATLQALLESLPNSAFRPGRKQEWTTLDIDEELTSATVVPNQRRSFRQGNTAQNLRMREWLQTRAGSLDKNRTVLELFCGSGNFTEVLAAAGFVRILAVEGVEDSVQELAARKLPGVEARRCNLFAETDLPRLQEQARDASILVLDPPRDGFKLAGLLLTKKNPGFVTYFIFPAIRRRLPGISRPSSAPVSGPLKSSRWICSPTPHTWSCYAGCSYNKRPGRCPAVVGRQHARHSGESMGRRKPPGAGQALA